MTQIPYIGVSKTQSLKFKKPSYLLSMTETGVTGRLLEIEYLKYGHVESGPYFKLGTKRGWYTVKNTIDKNDLEKIFEIKSGTIKI